MFWVMEMGIVTICFFCIVLAREIGEFDGRTKWWKTTKSMKLYSEASHVSSEECDI